MIGTGVLRMPPQVWFGRGTRARIPGAVADNGRRALLVADPVLAQSEDFAALLTGLAALEVTTMVQSDFTAELPLDCVIRMSHAATSFEPEVIVGYGGGSAMDAAKLVALLVRHGGRLSDYYGENAVPGPVVPVVAVPTTAGTGSEVTPVAVVSDPDREMKVGVSSPHLVPTYAIVDPDLTLGVPATVTAHSGIDALVHAVESYTARHLPLPVDGVPPVFTGRNALGEVMSLDAVRRIGSALELAVSSPADVRAREAMAYGSLMAGMAFSATGTHLSHALQYPIGAMTHTPHGLGTGMMLPYVLEACRPAADDRLDAIGAALGLDPGGDMPARTIERISQIGERIGLPRSLADIGLTRGDLPRVAELAMKSVRLIGVAPVDVTVELLCDVLESAHAGHLSTASTA